MMVGGNAVCVFSGSGDNVLGKTLIPPSKQYRYGNFVVANDESKTVMCIREDHGVGGEAKPDAVVNTIVKFEMGGEKDIEVEVIVQGADFYSSLALSKNNNYLAFIEWNHPNMPWDATLISEVDLKSNTKSGVFDSVSSSTQPRYDNNNKLHFLSDVDDEKGCYDLYRADRVSGSADKIIAIGEELVAPDDGWSIGVNSYAFTSSGKIVCACNLMGGGCDLVILDGSTTLRRAFEDVDSMSELVLGGEGELVYFLGGSYNKPKALFSYDLEEGASSLKMVMSSSKEMGKLEALSSNFVKPEHIFYDTEGNGEGVHAYFYDAGNPRLAEIRSELEYVASEAWMTGEERCDESFAMRRFAPRRSRSVLLSPL